MPFLSGRQERFMWANHPEIAKRWTEAFGSFEKTSHSSKPTGTSSEESPNPRIAKLPRLSGFKRDFAPLKPSSSGRFIPKNRPTPNLHEAEKQGPVQGHPGSRHNELGLKLRTPKGFHLRDHNAARR